MDETDEVRGKSIAVVGAGVTGVQLAMMLARRIVGTMETAPYNLLDLNVAWETTWPNDVRVRA